MLLKEQAVGPLPDPISLRHVTFQDAEQYEWSGETDIPDSGI